MNIIASDFDGTLNRNGQILESDLNAINEFRSQGNRFGIITGREIRSITRHLSEIGFMPDFLIVNNGAQVFENGKQIYEKTIDRSTVSAFTEYAAKYGCTYLYASADDKHIPLIDKNKCGSCDGDSVSVFAENIETMEAIHHMNTYFDCDAKAEVFTEIVNSKFGKTLSAYQNGCCVDIPPAGISKSTGIMEYVRYCGVSESDAFAVGDNLNDMPMIKDFFSFAVMNARDEIKATAKKTVNDFTEIISIIAKRDIQ